MKKNNLKRFLASLLAVLMLASVTGVSPAVFADWGSNVSLTAAKATDKRLELNGDKEIRIPYKDNGDIDFDALYPLIFETCVNKSKSALQSYDKDKIDIKQEKNAYHKLEGDTFCDPIKEDQTYTIKFTYHYGSLLWEKTEQSCKITFLGREALPAVAEKITVAATFTDDLSINYDALRQDIFDQVKAQVNLPENVKFENVSFKYYFTYNYKIGIYKEWVAFEGKKGVNIGDLHINIPAVACGSTYKVQLSWGGDDTYKAWSPEFDVTVVDGRTDTSISFVEDRTVNIPFTETGIDYEAVKTSIWALVDTITPADISKDSITVKYDGTNINDNPAISEGNHTLNFSYAGSANYKPFSTDVPVNFIDNRAPVFELKTELPGTLKIGYVGDDIDAAKTEENVRNQLVQKAENGDLELDNVKVEFKSVTGDYTALTVAGIKAHKVGATEALDKLVTPANIRLSYAGDATHKAFNVIVDTLKFDDYRVASSIAIKDGASITFNMSADNMKQQIFDNVIDWDSENTKLPAKGTLTIADFKFKIGSKDIADKDGYPNLDAGNGQTIKISFVGNSEFKPCNDVEATIDVAKADVKVNVKRPVIIMHAGDKDLPEGSITLTPDDKSIDVYTVFAGITSKIGGKVTTSVYLDLPDRYTTDNKLLTKVLDPLFKSVIGRTFTDVLQEGITVGELKQLAAKASEVADKLGKIGIDVESFTKLMDTIANLPGIVDDMRIAIGTPNHAGIYQAFVITNNVNYNTAYGTGTVLVLKQFNGISLVKNSAFDANGGKITVSQAAEIADSVCILSNDDGPLDNEAQGAVRYLFTGIKDSRGLYSNKTMPTEPGRYIVTATVRGGDFFAFPKTFSFKIVADPTPNT